MWKYFIICLIIVSGFLNAGETKGKKLKREDLPYSKTEEVEKLKTILYGGDHLISEVYSGEPRGYYHIAVGFAQLEDFDTALGYADQIEAVSDKDRCYFQIISEMLYFKEVQMAKDLSNKITDVELKNNTIRMIIDHKILNKYPYEEIMIYAENSENTQVISHTKQKITHYLLSIDEYGDAVEFFKQQKDTESTNNGLLWDVSELYLKNGDLEGFIGFLNDTGITFDDNVINMVISKAGRYGNEELVVDLIESLPNKDKDRNYLRIALNLIERYQYPEAYRYLPLIKEIENRDRFYFSIAQNSLREGNLLKAISYEDSIYTLKVKDDLYKRCVERYLKTGDIERSLELYDKINDLSEKERIAGKIAFNCFRQGDLQRYEEMRSLITEDKILEDLYEEIARKYLQRKQLGKVDPYLELIKDGYRKNNLLYSLALQYGLLNNYDKALEYIELISDPVLKESSLNELEMWMK